VGRREGAGGGGRTVVFQVFLGLVGCGVGGVVGGEEGMVEVFLVGLQVSCLHLCLGVDWGGGILDNAARDRR